VFKPFSSAALPQKSEYRSTKSETIPKHEIQSEKFLSKGQFGILDFELVSDFDIRI